MICLYDVRNVARAVRDNVDTGPASQAPIELHCERSSRAQVVTDFGSCSPNIVGSVPGTDIGAFESHPTPPEQE
jgi:hypothetical protein